MVKIDNKTKKIIINGFKKHIKQCEDRIKSYRAGIEVEEKTIREVQIMINDFKGAT